MQLVLLALEGLESFVAILASAILAWQIVASKKMPQYYNE